MKTESTPKGPKKPRVPLIKYRPDEKQRALRCANYYKNNYRQSVVKFSHGYSDEAVFEALQLPSPWLEPARSEQISSALCDHVSENFAATANTHATELHGRAALKLGTEHADVTFDLEDAVSDLFDEFLYERDEETHRRRLQAFREFAVRLTASIDACLAGMGDPEPRPEKQPS